MDRLYFHARSAPAPAGRGVHESVYDPTAYESLSRDSPHWRRALHDTWPMAQPIYLALEEGRPAHQYNTVEHVIQCQRSWLAFKGYYGDSTPFEESLPFYIFCSDAQEEFRAENRWGAGDALSNCCLMHGSYAHMFATPRLNPLQEYRWKEMGPKIRALAQWAKFSQDGTLRSILLQTGDAELWDAKGRVETLEYVRAALRAGMQSPLPFLEGDGEAEQASDSEES